jgi:hypothetical protein
VQRSSIQTKPAHIRLRPALLKRAATSKANGQQIIFSTSEKRDRLDSMLKNLDCNYIKFDGKMLTPVPEPQ